MGIGGAARKKAKMEIRELNRIASAAPKAPLKLFYSTQEYFHFCFFGSRPR